MSETNLESAATSSTSSPVLKDSADLQAQVTELRSFVRKLQTSLIAAVWLLGLFVFLQFWRANKDVVGFRQAAAQQQWSPLVQAYENDKNMVQKFLNDLGAYGAQHKDLQPILQKYGIGLPAPSATPAASTSAPAGTAPKPAPASAPATAPKK